MAGAAWPYPWLACPYPCCLAGWHGTLAVWGAQLTNNEWPHSTRCFEREKKSLLTHISFKKTVSLTYPLVDGLDRSGLDGEPVGRTVVDERIRSWLRQRRYKRRTMRRLFSFWKFLGVVFCYNEITLLCNVWTETDDNWSDKVSFYRIVLKNQQSMMLTSIKTVCFTFLIYK